MAGTAGVVVGGRHVMREQQRYNAAAQQRNAAVQDQIIRQIRDLQRAAALASNVPGANVNVGLVARAATPNRRPRIRRGEL